MAKFSNKSKQPYFLPIFQIFGKKNFFFLNPKKTSGQKDRRTDSSFKTRKVGVQNF